MTHPILGLHHVTATVDEAQPDLDFAIDALGLRLVKKTVNFDNHHVYHFYYGDEQGTPGTIWTTFPYHGRGVRVGSKGAGQVTVTSFSVPTASLGFWRTHLRSRGITVTDVAPRFGRESIRCADQSGLNFELVATDDPRTRWTGGSVNAETAIRGLHSVTMVVRETEKTLALMSELLGFHVVDENDDTIRVAVKDGRPGQLIDIVRHPQAPPAVNGIGTVHHVAMAISSGDEQRRLQQELVGFGCQVTDVRDRCYFTSIYFREPGGVLFEVATVGPGFTVDEPLPALGTQLQLPPWEQPHRQEIEAGLAPVHHR
jgi:glyoxalase family protein